MARTVQSGTTNSVTGNLFLPKHAEVFSYDADGNLTNDGRWAYVWDGENRLLSITSRPSSPAGSSNALHFAYDWQGRRVSKTVSNYSGSAWSKMLDEKYLYDGWNLVSSLNASNNAVVLAFLWGTDLSGSMQGAGGVGGLLAVKAIGASVTFPSYDGNGNVTALINAADGSIIANHDYGPFGEVIRASGTAARTNPFRFSTKYQDDETDLLYYGYRYLSASMGRWPNRDPIGELGGRNLYNFVQNDSVNGVDFVGLCKVHSSGFRYRVSIAALDAHQVGTPYADLAKFAKNFLDTHPNYQPLQMTAPNFTSSGPFTFSNPALNGGQIPAGTFVAAHYLFYVDWEIDETDGPCGLNVSETGTIQRGNNPPQPGPPRSGPAPAGSWTKADRKQPLGTCTKTLIFVDAPGSRAYLKRVPGIPATFGGFTQTVNQKFEVVNQKTGAIVHTSSHSVTIGLTDSGGLIANP